MHPRSLCEKPTKPPPSGNPDEEITARHRRQPKPLPITEEPVPPDSHDDRRD